LTEHFQESLRFARRETPGALAFELQMLNFDWHANVKALGEEKAVEGLWSKMRPVLEGANITVG
jgi:hypothetical protein